jgi:hypothetical protein
MGLYMGLCVISLIDESLSFAGLGWVYNSIHICDFGNKFIITVHCQLVVVKI